MLPVICGAISSGAGLLLCGSAAWDRGKIRQIEQTPATEPSQVGALIDANGGSFVYCN